MGKKMKCKKTTSLVTNNLDGALGWKKNRITKGLKMCYYSVMWRASWFNPPAHLALYVHLLRGGPGKGNLELNLNFMVQGFPCFCFFLTEFPRGTQPRDK